MILLFSLSALTSSETCTIYGGPRSAKITDSSSQCINVVDSYFFNLAGFFQSSANVKISITHSEFYRVVDKNTEVDISNAISIYVGECYFKKDNSRVPENPVLNCNPASSGTFNFNVSTIQTPTRLHDISCTSGQSFTSSNGNISFIDLAVDGNLYNTELAGVDLYITVPFTINYMSDIHGLYGSENSLYFGSEGSVSNTNICNSIIWKTGKLIKCNSKSIVWANVRLIDIKCYDSGTLIFDSAGSCTFTNCFYKFTVGSSLGVSKSGLSATTESSVSPNMHLRMAGCAASKQYIYEEFPVPTRSPYPPCPPQEVKPKPKRPIRRVVSSGATLAMTNSI